jgi:hypothetical protein
MSNPNEETVQLDMFPVKADEQYTDTDGNKYYYCNTTSNNKEYYMSPESVGNKVGSVLSIPFLISSIISISSFVIIFGAVALSLKYGSKEKKTTTGVIIFVVLFFICLLSMISSIVSVILNINEIKDKGERPCYSKDKKQLIE